MRLNTKRGKTDHFEVSVGKEGSKLNPGRTGVLVYLKRDDDPWQAVCVWVSPIKAIRMAESLLRVAERAEKRGG